MRIILLTQWYPPETETRIHMMAKSLIADGHSVTTITGFPNYPTGKVFPGYKIKILQRETMDGVKVLRVPLYPSHDASAVRRICNYMSFAISAAILGPIVCGPADVMWVYHPPLTSALPAFTISKLRHVPFMFEVQDMWPETLEATGFSNMKRTLKLINWFAGIVYRHASKIIVISNGFKQNLVQKGVPDEKIAVIPNWADETLYRPIERDESFCRQWGLTGFFNVVYGGNVGSAQGLENLLAAAELLKNDSAIKILIIGEGVERDCLMQQAKARNIENIRFIERQPSSVMPFFYANADALLVHLKDDPLFRITIPGKLSAYLACGKPIICSVGGDAAKIVETARAGLTVRPEAPRELARAITSLSRMTEQQRDELGRNGRSAFESSYSQNILMHKYREIFKELSKNNRGR